MHKFIHSTQVHYRKISVWFQFVCECAQNIFFYQKYKNDDSIWYVILKGMQIIPHSFIVRIFSFILTLCVIRRTKINYKIELLRWGMRKRGAVEMEGQRRTEAANIAHILTTDNENCSIHYRSITYSFVRSFFFCSSSSQSIYLSIYLCKYFEHTNVFELEIYLALVTHELNTKEMRLLFINTSALPLHGL